MREIGATDVIRLEGHLSWRHVRDGICITQDAGRQTVTTVGRAWLVDKLQDIPTSLQQLKFHQTGTGATVATSADLGLQTPIGTPVVGTRGELTSTIFQSVATINYVAPATVTEWGIFTTTTGGVMFARKTLLQPVIVGDGIQFTWKLTIA